MVTNEEIVARLKERSYYPQKVNELAAYFAIPDEQYTSFAKQLHELEESYEIYRSHANRYLLPEAAGIYRGILKKNDRGYGYVDFNNGMESFFIAPDHMNYAENKDEVLVMEVGERPDSTKRREGKILRIITRGINQFVATVGQQEHNVWRLYADDQTFKSKLIILEDQHHQLVVGNKVLVKVKAHVTENKITVELVEVLGHENDPGMDILSYVAASGAPYKFSDEVIGEANKRADEAIAMSLERQDYRSKLTVTIDGSDAKDLDDAVSFEVLENGNFELGVHIADVSHYVVEGSVLDISAYDRGTSIYLADRVIPMLPHVLSNGVCSLNPHVDRYSMTCLMEIDAQGSVVNYSLAPSMIHSDHRMTYSEVNQMLSDDFSNISEEKSVLGEWFKAMNKLAKLLGNKRHDRGSIDFNFDEAKIVVDENGKAIDVVLRERGEAERLIEEFMLIANETVAKHLFYANLPSLYRVHEEPKMAKLITFANFAKSLGFQIKGNVLQPHPKSLQAVLEQIKGSDSELVISTMLLRSLQKARYSEEALGHFGLATKYYTHFTSPIRRYPDLIIHRLLKEYFSENKIGDSKFISKMEEIMPKVANDTSTCEQRAVDLERKVLSMKEAEYMENKIGNRYKGTISSITSFGLFVTLDNLIEGLVHMSELRDDHYVFIEKTMQLAGQRTGKKYRVGDQVEIIVARSSKKEARIDFIIINPKMTDETIVFLQSKMRRQQDGTNGERHRSSKYNHRRANDRDNNSQNNRGSNVRNGKRRIEGKYERKRDLKPRRK